MRVQIQNGVAGFARLSDSTAELAYHTGTVSLAPGQRVSVDDAMWRVTSTAISRYSKSVTVASLSLA